MLRVLNAHMHTASWKSADSTIQKLGDPRICSSMCVVLEGRDVSQNSIIFHIFYLYVRGMKTNRNAQCMMIQRPTYTQTHAPFQDPKN